MLKKIEKRISSLLKLGTLLSTAGFIGTTLIQIYARFFIAKAPSWTEEAARLFFVLAIGFSSGLALKGNYYVHFDFLYNKLRKQWQRKVKILISASIFLLFVLFSFYSMQFMVAGWAEKSPSLKIPMAIAFCSMLILGISLSFYAFLKLLSEIKKRGL